MNDQKFGRERTSEMSINGFLLRLKSIGLNQKSDVHPDDPITNQRLSDLGNQWRISEEIEGEERESPYKRQ